MYIHYSQKRSTILKASVPARYDTRPDYPVKCSGALCPPRHCLPHPFERPNGVRPHTYMPGCIPAGAFSGINRHNVFFGLSQGWWCLFFVRSQRAPVCSSKRYVHVRSIPVLVILVPVFGLVIARARVVDRKREMAGSIFRVFPDHSVLFRSGFF